MVRVIVDTIPVDVPEASSVLQACELAGKEIPRFCYHEKLSIAGNCRMCLVQIGNGPKPVASCAFPISPGMVIWTDTEMVRRARRGVMEFLLINHPLDCPICDQGGECDLQDQAVGYGKDHSRFTENKRAVKDKYLGPLVKTVMTRCILCTRCVRFATEIAGVPELGSISRGENMEITNYVSKALTSELSGNLVDICPVGALTSKPYAFIARPWELRRTDGIDVLDAVGTNVSVQARGGAVLRITPRRNDWVNEEWLADKGRFSVDALTRNRLDRPWLKREGQKVAVSWQEAFVSLAEKIKQSSANRIGALVGDLCDVESMFALKGVMAAIGSGNIDCRIDGADYDTQHRAFYTFNSGIAGIEQADALLIIGSVPRHEAPVINARIRKRYLQNQLPIAVIGHEDVDLTYAVDFLGDDLSMLENILDGTHPFATALKNAKRPMIIVGHGALRRRDARAVLSKSWAVASAFGALTSEWNGFNVLHMDASRVGALDIDFLPQEGGLNIVEMLNGGVDILWLLGVDNPDVIDRIPESSFVIYQGHHGGYGAQRADMILPGTAYTEKAGLYVNTEGRVQQSFQAVFPPGEAKEDWRILRAFSEVLNSSLPYNTHQQLREELYKCYPHFAEERWMDERVDLSTIQPDHVGQVIENSPLHPAVINYYQTNIISLNSPTMEECTRVYVQPSFEREVG
ncbi:NADH-quinone oxidoreductase subunit NuoG [Entomobacter blattae]|uniref:NADH-quinone oxidoreductase n=1 Tax=Entomobacter blattae TaxID=2762277 RepID=A0A7H1NSX5_9PROT|nr:NADH-quinone oxidoreductase subunit NuoG [Entomobacter blattae]QNT78885.1 NADH-quinone oxidoreductase chain 3 [Entomobacter blattae]